MSYLVLARKYRPHNFDEMVGQEHVVQALSNALSQQRLHHAYLFTGTRGVGKTTVSRILAKSLNCQGPDGQGGITAHPCGVCQACRDIDAGRFVDYTELDAASNRGVEEVQSLMEQAVYKPVQGRFKVFMIDEVHMLSNTAFNAMLKTLEEPPEYLKFVLATTDPQKVPVTVLSRCLQFNLRPMAPQTVAEHLEHVLGQEGIARDKASLQLLARAARGSMRDALSLTDQAIAYGDGALQESGVRQMLGVVDKRYVTDAIAALAAADGRAVVALVNTLRQQGIPAVSLLEDMALALQAMALYQSLGEVPDEVSDDPDARQLQSLATQLPPDETQLLYTFCLKGREELGLAPDEYSGLVMVLLRLLAFKLPPGEVRLVRDSPPLASQAHGSVGQVDEPSGAAVQASSVADAAVEYVPTDDSGDAVAAKAQTVSAGTSVPAEPLPWEDAAAPAPVGASAPEVAAQVPPPSATERLDQVAHSRAAADDACAQGTPAGIASSLSNTLERAAAHRGLEESLHGEAEVVAQPVAAVVPEALARHDTQEPGATARVANEVAHGDGGSGNQPPPRDDAAHDAHAASRLEAPVGADPHVASVSHALLDAAPELASWWRDLVSRLVGAGVLTALVRELAMQSELIRRDDAGLWLRIANTSLMTEPLRKKLQAALAEAGVSGTVTLEQGGVQTSPALMQQAQREAEQRMAEQIVENDPRVQWLKAHLGGEVVPGSVRPVGQPAPAERRS